MRGYKPGREKQAEIELRKICAFAANSYPFRLGSFSTAAGRVLRMSVGADGSAVANEVVFSVMSSRVGKAGSIRQAYTGNASFRLDYRTPILLSFSMCS